jgi:hypothetical protein
MAATERSALATGGGVLVVEAATVLLAVAVTRLSLVALVVGVGIGSMVAVGVSGCG